MSLSVGPMVFDEPTGEYLPVVGIAVGAIDAEEEISLSGRAVMHKKAEPRVFRRLMSTSQTPLPPSSEPASVLSAELNRVVESLHGKVTETTDETVCGFPGKFIEVHYRKAGNDLAAFILLFCGNGLLYSFSLTVLKGKKTDDARKEFRTLQKSLRLAG